jgi:hypothetical protein
LTNGDHLVGFFEFEGDELVMVTPYQRQRRERLEFVAHLVTILEVASPLAWDL